MLDTTAVQLRRAQTTQAVRAVIVMLSAVSFSDELAGYQTAVPKYQQTISHWRAMAGANELWRRIQDAASRHGLPALDAKEFIGFVLSATWFVERLIEHDKQIRLEFFKLKKEMKQVVADADTPSELARHLSTFDGRIEALHRSSYDFNSPPISRKDQRGSRDRKAFAQRMGKYLKGQCGEFRDEDVAILQAIVFPGRGDSVDKVRLSRRASTREGRKARCRKGPR